jgi:hypothetical protein
MNIGQVVIIGLLVVLVILALRPATRPIKKVTFEDGYNPDWGLHTSYPVTWNFDWGGGPGYDRHRIMHSRGPYNMRGEEITGVESEF